MIYNRRSMNSAQRTGLLSRRGAPREYRAKPKRRLPESE